MAFRTASTHIKTMLLGTVCCFVWGGAVPVAKAQALPSVEVNIDALRDLEPQPLIQVVPLPPRPVIVPPTERKIPSEQPGYHPPRTKYHPKPHVTKHRIKKPAPAPEPVVEPEVAPTPQAPEVTAPSAPVVKPVLKKPAPKPVPKPTPKPVHVPKPVIEVPPPTVTPEPSTSGFMPLVSPETKPDIDFTAPPPPPVSKPVPVVTLPAAPPKAAVKEKPAAPAPKTAPPPPPLPKPKPVEKSNAPDVDALDFSKLPAASEGEPPVVFVPIDKPDQPKKKEPVALPPSVEKRVNSMMSKEPKKQGIISDKTHIDDPSIKIREELQAKERDAAEAAADAKAKQQSTIAPEELPPALPDADSTKGTSPLMVPVPEKLPPAELPAPEKPAPKVVAPKPEEMAPPPPPPLPAAKHAPADNNVPPPAPKVSSVPVVEVKQKETVTPPPPPPPVSPVVTSKPPASKDVVPSLPALTPLTGEHEAEKEMQENALPVPPPPISVPPLSPVKVQAISKTITFDRDKTDLADAAKTELAEVAEALKQSQGSVRIVAYAAGTTEQASVAKRISLSRALAIRAFLIGKGVNQLNITVQALGNQVKSGNADRADVFVK